jgi:hypothetical protein
VAQNTSVAGLTLHRILHYFDDSILAQRHHPKTAAAA